VLLVPTLTKPGWPGLPGPPAAAKLAASVLPLPERIMTARAESEVPTQAMAQANAKLAMPFRVTLDDRFTPLPRSRKDPCGSIETP